MHEDNEILGVFSPEVYTHFTPGKALLSLGCFVAGFLGLCGAVNIFYSGKPFAPRTFPDGLEKELGGPHALPVSEYIFSHPIDFDANDHFMRLISWSKGTEARSRHLVVWHFGVSLV